MILPSKKKQTLGEGSHLVIHILRLELGDVRAIFTSTVFRSFWTSLEVFGHLRESLDMFVSSSKNLALTG